jgi:hypothetical protein
MIPIWEWSEIWSFTLPSTTIYPLITTMNREILSASGFSTADYKENHYWHRDRYLCIHQRSRYSRYKTLMES